MKTIIATLLTFGIISNSVSAQVPTEKTLLWQIRGKGISKPSYLFGTIHLMCKDDIKVPPIVKERFDATKQLYMEIDTDDPKMMAEMMSNMKMKDSVTLQQLMGSRYDTISKVFLSATNGTPLSVLSVFKPIFLMSYLYPSLLGCMPASWEKEFENMAKEKKKEIHGLEKLKDQFDVFDKIPYQEQADLFVKLLLNSDSSKIKMQKLLDIYNKKDVAQLNLLTIMDDDLKKYEDVLLTNRNQNWIPIIGREAKKQPTFFAFGAGHLGGVHGVIALLRKAGYKVTAVIY